MIIIIIFITKYIITICFRSFRFVSSASNNSVYARIGKEISSVCENVYIREKSFATIIEKIKSANRVVLHNRAYRPPEFFFSTFTRTCVLIIITDFAGID